MAKNKRRIAMVASTEAAPGFSGVSQFLAWTSLAWLIWIAFTYQDRFPWMTRVPDLPALSTAPAQGSVFIADGVALILMIPLIMGFPAAGSYLLRLFRLPLLSPLEEAVLSLGLGMGSAGF